MLMLIIILSFQVKKIYRVFQVLDALLKKYSLEVLFFLDFPLYLAQITHIKFKLFSSILTINKSV